ncbi:MAG: FtsX-like permease family protein [Bacteroidota bacterium]
MKKSPAKISWLERIILTICDPGMQESILGDLQELYEERLATKGKWRAAWSYFLDALGFLRPFAWKKFKLTITDPSDMIKNYIKLGYRNFTRQKITSAINVLGFTIGIISCLIIALFIVDELSFDGFHQHKDRIYRMAIDIRQQNGNISKTAFSPAPWAPAMTDAFPEVEAYTRFMRYRLPVAIGIKESQQQFYERDFLWADSSLFSMFTFPLVEGNPETALTQPNTVVISQSAAQRYFGDIDPMGQLLTYEGRQDLKVTGVFKDLPANSHIKAELFASFGTLNNFWDIIDNWRILYYYSYFLLKEESNIETVAAKMPGFIDQHLGEEGTQRFIPQWQPLSSIHLDTGRDDELEAGGNKQLLYLFAAIACLIFLIAGANYTNLATASAVRRAKEIGIRKVLGSRQRQLVFQFLAESILQMGIALVLAVLVTQQVLPYFNDFTGKNISIIPSGDNHMLLLALIGSGILLGVLAGLYPAFYLAKLRPVHILKKAVNGAGRKMRSRQFLVVFQFATCAALIAGTLIINHQFEYITKKDPGFSRDQMLLFRLNGEYLNNPQNIPAFKKQLLSEPGVKATSISSHRIVGDQPYYGRYRFAGIPGLTDEIGMGRLHVDEDFVKTFDIPLLAGRAFDNNRITDTSAFLINKTALQRLGLQTPQEAIGKLVSYETRGASGAYLKQGPIIGVTDDFHFRSLHFQVEPMVMDIQPARYHFLAVKLTGQAVDQHIQNLENQWQRLFPDGLFEYQFLDDLLALQYTSEQKMRTLFSLFSFLGILIACMGLFGLTTFLTSQRRKEIAVRKILGATPAQILTLLSKDIFRLVLIGLFIGLPLTFYLAVQWLANFSYRIDLGARFFLDTALLAVLIALLTIAAQALKTVLASPVNSLRQE